MNEGDVMANTKTLTQADLDRFTGTEQWYRHALTGFTFTDGVKYLAETAGAFWLVDEIALANRFNEAVKAQPFQVWTLTVGAGNVGFLSVEDGDGNSVFKKAIPYTDFPLPKVTVWFSDNVMLLPSEY